jgi:hypothetical protein
VKKKNKNKSITINICTWYKITKKILNFTKNKPTGGNPVRQKSNQRYSGLVGVYFFRKIIKLDIEKFISRFKGICEKINNKIAKKITR